MGRDSGWGSVLPPPSAAPMSSVDRGDRWRHVGSSVNAVSFGFVATAVLILMFLVMAIFEKLLRSRSTAAGGRNRRDLESHASNQKLSYPSPKITTYGRGVSVLMPGDAIPTFIAHPVPAPHAQNL